MHHVEPYKQPQSANVLFLPVSALLLGGNGGKVHKGRGTT
jgi:hypothetical protein